MRAVGETRAQELALMASPDIFIGDNEAAVAGIDPISIEDIEESPRANVNQVAEAMVPTSTAPTPKIVRSRRRVMASA